MLNIKYSFTLFFFVIAVSSSAQTSDQFMLYKKDWSLAADINSAAYFMHRVVDNDTTYTCRYYQKNGPLVKLETYYDSNLSIPNGLFAWYNYRGYLDSTGFVFRGKKDKTWRYGFNADGKASMVEEFSSGILVKRIDIKAKTVIFPSGEKSAFVDSSAIKNP